jgi:hypothetical protein
MPAPPLIARIPARRGPLALLLLLLVSAPAGALTGVLGRATPAFLVIDGERYRVGRDARLLAGPGLDPQRDIYALTPVDLERLPPYDSRRLQAVHRVRVRLEGGAVRVVQPLEYRR